MKESDIQREIIAYLKKVEGGKVIRLDGQGLMMRGIIVKQYKTVLDILFLYKGQAYFFEVKTPVEKEFILKHSNRLLEGDFNSDNKNLKRYKNQLEEVKSIKYTGNFAGFVSSLEDVISAIN